MVVEQEGLIDAVTAISGSGPAYFFVLMEEMVKAAVTMGLPVDIAEQLVYQTAKGAGVLAKLAYARGESPAELRRKVTSPAAQPKRPSIPLPNSDSARPCLPVSNAPASAASSCRRKPSRPAAITP